MEFCCLGLCTPEEEAVLRRGVAEFARRRGRPAVLECFHRRELLLYRVRQGACDAALVALPGALGMEAAMGVRGMDKRLPLVWMSDDEVFAMESYRLQAQMFLLRPATEEQIADALERCVL